MQRENFLYFIRKIEHSLRLFITSRSNIDLLPKFTNTLQINIAARSSDIKSYLAYHISRSPRMSLFTARDASLKQEIMSTVSQKAQGMYVDEAGSSR